MSEIVSLQQRFAVQIARLILAAEARGIGLRFGDCYRDPRVTYGHPNSLHRQRLAVDLIAEDEAHHVELHDLWDTMGGAPRIEGDYNHYSFERSGMT